MVKIVRGALAIVVAASLSCLTVPSFATNSVQLTVSLTNPMDLPQGISGTLSVTCRTDGTSTAKALPFSGGTVTCGVPSGTRFTLMIDLLLWTPNSNAYVGQASTPDFRLNAGWFRELALTSDTTLTITLPTPITVNMSAVTSAGTPTQTFTATLDETAYGRFVMDSAGGEYTLGIREWQVFKSTRTYAMLGYAASGRFNISAEDEGTTYTWQSGSTSFVNGLDFVACIDTGKGKYSSAPCAQTKDDEIQAARLQAAQVDSKEFQRLADEVLAKIDAGMKQYGNKAAGLSKWKSAVQLLIQKNPGRAGFSQIIALRNTVDADLKALAASSGKSSQPTTKPGAICTKVQLGKTVQSGNVKLKCVLAKGKSSPVWTRTP